MNSQLEEALNGIALTESGHTSEKEHEEIEQLRKDCEIVTGKSNISTNISVF